MTIGPSRSALPPSSSRAGFFGGDRFGGQILDVAVRAEVWLGVAESPRRCPEPEPAAGSFAELSLIRIRGAAFQRGPRTDLKPQKRSTSNRWRVVRGFASPATAKMTKCRAGEVLSPSADRRIDRLLHGWLPWEKITSLRCEAYSTR